MANVDDKVTYDRNKNYRNMSSNHNLTLINTLIY